ncbi:MAG TPA: hypothetical protein VKF82_11155 [Candidatus Eremiobacteraceae bacterium]|nr:hypothetical protein [Candidatus Eremiobacteraceae bacterium]
MATAQIDVVKELQDSFQLLIKNWMLALPTAIAALLGSVLRFMIFGALAAGALSSGVLGSTGNQGAMTAAMAVLASVGLIGLIGGIVLALIGLVAQATVVYGATDIWAGRPLDLSSALSRGFAKLPQMIVGLILIVLLAIIPCILVFLFIGVFLLLALGFFVMYWVPGVVIGNKSGMEAIGDSFNLAKNNFGPSALAFLGIFVVVLVGGFVDMLFSHIIGLNFLVSFVVGGFIYAFAAIVVVRMYELLTRSASLAPAATPPAPTA